MANQTLELADLLGAEGIDVHVASTNAPYRPAWIAKVRGLRSVFRFVPFLAAVRRLAASVNVMHVMANSGWTWFLCAAPAINAATRRGVPVVVHYHGGLAREFLARSASRVVPTLRRASAVVVPSRFLQEVFAAHGVVSRIVSNGVDLETFRPPPERAPSSQGLHVVITRNLEEVYGIDTAIRAAALVRKEFPGLVFSIAGAGAQRHALERLVVELELTHVVRFTGRLAVAEVVALYADADIVLNPSRADNTPGSLLEAAACGVPIVSTNVGGVPYLVEHGRSAWLVPPDSPDAMAEAIVLVACDSRLRRELRAGGIEIARACSWPTVKHQWLQLFEGVLREQEIREAASRLRA
jgi:glycosyltransferase involved in cell wall biosynthesis